MDIIRIPIAALVAVGVTFGLFLVMHKLISSGGDQRAEFDAIAGIHFGPVEIPDEIIIRSRLKPVRPPPPKDPPRPPKMQMVRMDKQTQNMPRVDMPSLDIPMV